MCLTTALKGHVDTSRFFNRYKPSGDFIKVEQRITSRDIDLQNSGNSWSSGGSMNLKAGGNIALVGAQINSQGYSASAGGSYQERAAYDVKEKVNIETNNRSGLGVHIAGVQGHATQGGVFGYHKATKDAKHTETHVDSTRTAIVTNINAGAGAVTRNVGGDAFIEGSIIRGGEGKVDLVNAGGKVTAVAAVDTRHVEDSVSTSSLVWQSTQSKGSIQQTLHMPEIHGLPANMSAYEGAGGVSAARRTPRAIRPRSI
ncbi:MAG: hemagglutinin repeat-containing protein [Hydrogenophaga sp.]|nr:hemagglutinin repeat-containing protein [Hydrogenophaga sp.]